MLLWRHRVSSSLTGLLVLASIAYPGFVYIGREQVAPAVYVGFALGLIALRLLATPSAAVAAWRWPLACAAAFLVLATWLDGVLAVKLYPVLLSLAAASVFGFSLLQPVCLVEGFAALRHPDVSPEGRRYCRRVTAIWSLWLAANAAIAAFLALYGSEAAWALWTGLLSYMAMGLLFAAEYLVRLRMQRAWA